jgi:maltose O-acetyltransferase
VIAKTRRYARWARAAMAEHEARQGLRERFPDAEIEDGVHIVAPDRLHLEPGAVLQAGCHVHCGGTEWTDGGGHVRIGRDTVIGPQCVLWGGGGLDIGGGVFLGPGTMVFSTGELFEADPTDPNRTHALVPVSIGDEARVGAQAIILPGAGMEAACALAGNSVLLKTVPTGKLYGGTPARELRDLVGFRHTLP